MKHPILAALLLSLFALPSLAQLSCDYIDPICQKARELVEQGQYKNAITGLQKAKNDSGIRNCPDAYKIDNLINEIQGVGARGHADSTAIDASAQIYTVNGVSFRMVKVDGGTFTMGATSEQGNVYRNEKPAHRVTLSDYYIGETEVTQALWRAVMGSNPSFFEGDSNPVECVSRDDCQEFIRKLNAATGKIFRLPTEAEWEFAARGGNKSYHTKYAGGSDLSSVAWCYDNSDDKTHPVAQKSPNELGLYDMSGNVWEWCQDYYDSDYYSRSPSTNPCNNTKASYRVLRGGSWHAYARECRVANRLYLMPGNRFFNLDLGLRLTL